MCVRACVVCVVCVCVSVFVCVCMSVYVYVCVCVFLELHRAAVLCLYASSSSVILGGCPFTI